MHTLKKFANYFFDIPNFDEMESNNIVKKTVFAKHGDMFSQHRLRIRSFKQKDTPISLRLSRKSSRSSSDIS